jgi:hypothetical protein
MHTTDARPTQKTGWKGLPRIAILGAVILSLLGFGAAPAAADAAAAPAPAKAPSSSLQRVSGNPAPGGVSTLATYVHNTRLYYWGADALVTVSSGQVSLGVFCTGYGWYQTQWMGVAPDGTPGVWRATVDCGSFIPATQYRYQTQG